MGLPGSGKTYLAERLSKHLNCAWFNADAIRKMANDWEFSENARIRQANRMRNLADFEKSYGRPVICDFVCPTNHTRNIFQADYIIWMNTIDSGRFADTNKIFETPLNARFIINKFLTDAEIRSLSNKLTGADL